MIFINLVNSYLSIDVLNVFIATNRVVPRWHHYLRCQTPLTRHTAALSIAPLESLWSSVTLLNPRRAPYYTLIAAAPTIHCSKVSSCCNGDAAKTKSCVTGQPCQLWTVTSNGRRHVRTEHKGPMGRLGDEGIWLLSMQ